MRVRASVSTGGLTATSRKRSFHAEGDQSVSADRGGRPWHTTRGPRRASRPSRWARCRARRGCRRPTRTTTRGASTREELEAEQDAAVDRLDRARRGDRGADHLRRRAALVELRDLRDHRHARGDRPGRSPGADGRPVLRDLRRRPQPPAAAADRRPVPLQDLRGRHAREVDRPREQADEAGRDRAVDARAALPARRRGPGLPARAVRGGPRLRVRDGHPPGVRRRRGARVDRLHRGPAGHPRRPAQPVDRRRACCRTSSSSTTACSTRFTAEERTNIGMHTCPGGDRDSVHSADVPYSDLLPSLFQVNVGYFLIQFASEREKDPVLRARSARTAGDDARSCYIGVTNPQNPRVGERAGDLRHARPRRRVHPEGAPRLDRRLRLLAVQHRREAAARLARLRPRRGVPEDRQPRRGHPDGRGGAGGRGPGRRVERVAAAQAA